MWTLINALQFIVAMSLWQIPYPDLIQTILFNLKKIAYGEMFDNFDFARALKEMLGLKIEPKSFENRIGMERFGSENLVENIGFTLIFITICIILICSTIIGLIYCIKRCRASEKWKERAQKLKNMVFFNPLIRYSFLSAVKLNIAAFIALRGKEGSTMNLVLAVTIIICLNLLPFFYSAFLYRNRSKLESEESKQKFGTLYDGLKHKHRVDRENLSVFRKHRVWSFPLIFLLRRTLFAAISVFLL